MTAPFVFLTPNGFQTVNYHRRPKGDTFGCRWASGGCAPCGPCARTVANRIKLSQPKKRKPPALAAAVLTESILERRALFFNLFCLPTDCLVRASGVFALPECHQAIATPGRPEFPSTNDRLRPDAPSQFVANDRVHSPATVLRLAV